MFAKKSVKHSLLLLLSLALLLTSLLNVACKKGRENGQSIDRVSLRLQWFHLAQFAGFYCAKDNGLYSARKIDLQINPGGPDFNAIPLVANGSDTFGVWTADQILIAQSRGVPITILAVIYREDPNVLMVMENSGIRSPADFRGKRITTVFGRATETVLRALLLRSGLTEKDVVIEPFPFNVMSFLQGKVDVSAAYSFDHPFQAMKAGAKIKIIRPSDYGIKFYSDCIFARNDLINKNPELVQRFISASLAGWEYALQNKSKAVDSVLALNPQLDRESQEFMLDSAEPLIRAEDPQRLGLVSDSSINAMVKILRDQGQVPKEFSGANIYDNQFVLNYYSKKK